MGRFYRYLHFASFRRSYKTCDKAMKCLTVFILSFFVIAGFFLASPVMAQEVTETPLPSHTPTITAPPPYEPSINLTGLPEFECLPEGTMPSGWGTVTPSTSWDLFCSDCYVQDLPTSTMQPSETPVPQPTWDGTGTPQPTWTVAPSATPSPSSTAVTATSTLSVCLNSFSYTGYGAGWGPTCTFTDSSHAGVWDLFADCSYSGGGGEGSVSPLTVYFNAPNTHTLMYWQTTFTNISNTYIDDCAGLCGEPVPGYLDEVVHAGTVNVHYSAMPSHWTVRFLGYESMSCVQGTPTPTPAPTPAPTATPDLSNYCAVVSDTSMDDSYFSYSGIVRTGESCFDLGGPAFSSDDEESWIQWWISDLWKSVGSPDMPYLAHICLVGIDIGVLTVFGVSVNLHIVAFFLGVALIIRNMFVS